DSTNRRWSCVFIASRLQRRELLCPPTYSRALFKVRRENSRDRPRSAVDGQSTVDNNKEVWYGISTTWLGAWKSRVHLCLQYRGEPGSTIGVVFVGGTVVVANPALLISELLCQVKDSECMYVVTDEYGATKFLEVQEEHHFEELFCVGDLPGFTDIRQFQELPQSSFEEHYPADNAEDVIALVHTTGSTGPPKGIEVSHKPYVSCFHSLDSLKLMAEEDVILAWLPITNPPDLLSTCFLCVWAPQPSSESSLCHFKTS
ncbi:unnamed protein product, partial [Ixodes persulcatus]